MGTGPGNVGRTLPIHRKARFENPPDSDATEMDFMNMFFTDEFVQSLVDDMNNYADRLASEPRQMRRKSRMQNWKPTNLEETWRFIGINFMMGIYRLPSIKSYWRKDSLHHTPFFGNVMSRDRYMLLLRVFNFGEVGEGRTVKIARMVDYFNKRMAELYVPGHI